MMGVGDKSGLPQPPHADRLMALLNQFAVGVFFVFVCRTNRGDICLLQARSLMRGAARLAVRRPDHPLLKPSVKTVAGRKALIAKGFGIILWSDLAWRL